MKAFIWVMAGFMLALWGFQNIKEQWIAKYPETTITEEIAEIESKNLRQALAICWNDEGHTTGTLMVITRDSIMDKNQLIVLREF